MDLREQIVDLIKKKGIKKYIVSSYIGISPSLFTRYLKGGNIKQNTRDKLEEYIRDNG